MGVEFSARWNYSKGAGQLVQDFIAFLAEGEKRTRWKTRWTVNFCAVESLVWKSFCWGHLYHICIEDIYYISSVNICTKKNIYIYILHIIYICITALPKSSKDLGRRVQTPSHQGIWKTTWRIIHIPILLKTAPGCSLGSYLKVS